MGKAAVVTGAASGNPSALSSREHGLGCMRRTGRRSCARGGILPVRASAQSGPVVVLG
jgi:hypothetical protein